MSEANQIHQLVPKVAADVGSIGKNARNEHFRFNYRSIDDVYSALHRALCAHGVTVTPVVREKEYSGCTCRLTVSYVLSAPDGSSITSTICAEAQDKADKATSKALSMAFKYWAFQQFCIPIEGSDDGDAGGHAAAPKRQPAKPAAKPAPRRTTETKDWASELSAKLGSKWVPTACNYFEDKKLLAEGEMLPKVSEKVLQQSCERFDDFVRALEKWAEEKDQLPS